MAEGSILARNPIFNKSAARTRPSTKTQEPSIQPGIAQLSCRLQPQYGRLKRLPPRQSQVLQKTIHTPPKSPTRFLSDRLVYTLSCVAKPTVLNFSTNALPCTIPTVHTSHSESPPFPSSQSRPKRDLHQPAIQDDSPDQP